ncbi:hypothetical protein MMC29_007442 [Sticta canariensis]|nr:hypothetical protein [Sticta canariensis]
MAPGLRTSTNHSRGHSSARPTSDLQTGLYSASSLPLNAEEGRYFHHFRQWCLPDLVGLVDAEFWNHYILQPCTSKPAVHHATLALSAQHKAFLTRGLSSDEECSPENERSSAFSWKQYGKAIKSLRCLLGHSSVNAENVEETLVICLLFVVSEVLQGNYREALMHLEGGLQIITDCYPSADLTTKQFSKDFSNSSLAKAFRRLDIQAASYVSSRNVKFFSATLGQCRQSVLVGRSGLEFANLREACDTLSVRVASVYHFMRSPAPSLSKHSYLSSKWVMDLKYEPLLQVAEAKENTFSSVLQEQKLHIIALRSWAFAFEAFLKRLTAHTSHAERAKFDTRTGNLAPQYAVLWISYLVISITLATIFEPDEGAYDRFLPHFEKIVEHAEFVLFHNTRDDEVPAERRRFSIEMNVIQPLYFTALKCRNHSLRHHAVALLHVSGQEGVWDGNMLSAIAKYIIEIEEIEGYVEIASEYTPIAELALEPDHQKLVILESARVHGVNLDVLDRVKGKVCIEFSKRNFTPAEQAIEQVNGFETYEWVFDKKLLEGLNEYFSLPK